MTRKQRVLMELELAGEQGLTVYRAIMNGLGTELRKWCCELRKDGYNITSKWEKKGKNKWKRYILETL